MLKEIIDFIKNHKWYVLLVVGLLGLYFYQFHGGLSSESEKWDHFGSYIGGIFSAVTLLSVLHGMQLERKRFNDQKIEFENEKKEQEERRRKEDFERTFFMMLEQHNLKISSIEDDIDNVYDELIKAYKFDSVRKRCEVGELNKEYANINVYFLNLYRILRYIYNNYELNVNNEYSGLLRSFLSRKLLVILAFHLCDRDKSYDSFIKYINKFHLLEHIDLIFLESAMLSKAMSSISQPIIYSNLIELENLNDDKLDNLILSLDNSKNVNSIVYIHIRSPEILACYKTVLSTKMKQEFLDVFKLNDSFNTDFFFNSLFLAIIKRFNKQAFEGNIYIDSILLNYKKYLD